MRHLAFSSILTLVLSLLGHMAQALEVEDRTLFGPETAAQRLTVLSTADTEIFAPVIDGFLAETPGVSVDYIVSSSSQVAAALEAGETGYDLVISSAMDLQTKLANDGLAASHTSDVAAGIPSWARWRTHLFAFTREPAALVFSRRDFDQDTLPQTRRALIEILRDNPDRFRGRIGTYDVRTSGLGYLFATQDARTSDTFWSLAEIFGTLDVQLYCCSGQMLDDVASGKLAVAYNVLGSYAAARDDADLLWIIYPQDFATVMLRTALIPKSAKAPAQARAFLDHLLAIAWADKPLENYAFERLSDQGGQDSNSSQIRLGPGLLAYLDRLKKASFLRAWESAVSQ